MAMSEAFFYAYFEHLKNLHKYNQESKQMFIEIKEACGEEIHKSEFYENYHLDLNNIIKSLKELNQSVKKSFTKSKYKKKVTLINSFIKELEYIDKRIYEDFCYSK
jgi:hypothetical protein